MIKERNISLLENIMWLVVLISFLSIFSLILGIFKPKLILIISIIIILIIYLYKKIVPKISIDKNIFLNILVILMIAIFFRINFEQYIIGGQDEGVYVNMSKYFENHGQVFPKDNFRESLKGELRYIYDKNNLKIKNIKKSKREGTYLPGVYIKDISKSQYVFQFYHLHPLWMAIIGNILGENYGQFSLIFFSLLSIVFFYFIILKITSNYFYSFLGAILLAINPLHIYFSKFPVTEVMALSFSLAGFYYLLLYYKNFIDFKEKNNRYLILSALIFGSLFLIRIHGFMYIPFFYILFLLSILSKIKIKKELIIYFLGIFLFFIFSIYYGYTYSYPYVTDIYNQSFSKVFGHNWSYTLIIIVFMMILIPLLTIKLNFIKEVIFKLKKKLIEYFYFLFFIILGLGIYKIYQLGFTEKYLNHPWLSIYWRISGSKINAILHSSFIALIEYTSLTLFIAFLFALKMYDRKNIFMNILIFFIFFFWVYALLLQYIIPYQYYYVRYLLSELIPYILLFTIIFLSNIKFQKISKIILFISIIYFLLISFTQLKNIESKGMYSSLNKIAKNIQKNDLLLISNTHLFSGYPMEIKTTLKYYFDLNIFSYNENQLNYIIYEYIKEFRNDIYILTKNQLNYNFITKLKTVVISIKTSNYTKNISPLVKYRNKISLYNLYKVEIKKFYLLLQKQYKILYQRNGYFGNRENFYDNTWTKNKSKISNLFYIIENEKYLKLSTFGWNPNRNKFNKLNLKIKINGQNIKFIKALNNNYYLKLPINLHIINNIEIHCNTFNPKKMNINNDNRELGIDIKYIQLLKELPR